jgi:hypothetical protein
VIPNQTAFLLRFQCPVLNGLQHIVGKGRWGRLRGRLTDLVILWWIRRKGSPPREFGFGRSQP